MRHKRRWAWKKKHVRKHQFHYGKDGPPKWFRNIFHRGNRTKERMDVKEIQRGFEDVDTNPKCHPSCAAWEWW